MRSYYDDLCLERDRILKKIRELEEQKQSLQEKPIKATTTYGYVDDIRLNSDTGLREKWGEKYSMKKLPAWQVRENIDDSVIEINNEIEKLSVELRRINNKITDLEWNKPENVTKRQQETAIKNREEQEQQFQRERLKHEERYDKLNKLVEYLAIAGMADLARRVSQLRFAFQKTKSDYINKEIDLQSKEKSFRTKTQTTKKEYKEIKRNVVKLSKEASKSAKKYKDLYQLYLAAREIVRDIEKKGIARMEGSELSTTLKAYFTQPSGEYYFNDYGSNYSLKTSENLGYQYLAFYRDYGSKYNEDVRKRRI